MTTPQKTLETIRASLAFFGLLFLWGFSSAVSFWLETHQTMHPIGQKVKLSGNVRYKQSFQANQAISEQSYDVAIYFPTCPTTDELKLEWSLTDVPHRFEWKPIPANPIDCERYAPIVKTAVTKFQAGTTYYLSLKRTSQATNVEPIKLGVSIQTQTGIQTHYLFADKAIAEILGGFSLLISVLCFTIYLWMHRKVNTEVR